MHDTTTTNTKHTLKSREHIVLPMYRLRGCAMLYTYKRREDEGGGINKNKKSIKRDIRRATLHRDNPRVRRATRPRLVVEHAAAVVRS